MPAMLFYTERIWRTRGRYALALPPRYDLIRITDGCPDHMADTLHVFGRPPAPIGRQGGTSKSSGKPSTYFYRLT